MTTQHNCAHSPDGWCLECVKKLADERDTLLEENKHLKLNIAALDTYYTTQLQKRRLDYEDGLPWQEDDRS